MLKYLISHILRNAEGYDFSCITLCRHFRKIWILFEFFNQSVIPLICTYKKYFTVKSLEKKHVYDDLILPFQLVLQFLVFLATR